MCARVCARVRACVCAHSPQECERRNDRVNNSYERGHMLIKAKWNPYIGRRGTRHYDTQHNDVQHNDTEHKRYN